MLEASSVIYLIDLSEKFVDGCEQALGNCGTVLRGPNPPLLRLKPKNLKLLF
jgi:hypothetical protein